jgi:hypothetical protein
MNYDPIEDETLLEIIENSFNKNEGCECVTCGWNPCFYEIERNIYRDYEEEKRINNKSFVFRTGCINKDDENSDLHKGSWIYIDK